MRIAILDDNPEQLRRLLRALEAKVPADPEPMYCLPFGDVFALRAALVAQRFDLVILDDSVAGCSAGLLGWLLGRRRSLLPIIVVSERSCACDAAAALNAGASDYVVKPLRPIEFRARARRFGRTEMFRIFATSRRPLIS